MPPALTTMLGWWSGYYGDHQVASVGIRFLHLTGLMLAGGTAITTDWQLLSAARRNAAARAEALARLAGSHVVVVPGLMLVVASGIAMAAADTETFLHSRLFGIKMALVAVLFLNGTALVTVERAVARANRPRAWTALATVSSFSLGLWLVLLLVGTWLTVAA